MVSEERVEQIPVRTCRMVVETAERQVPVSVAEQVPVTIQQTVAREVVRHVPVQTCTYVPVAVPTCFACD
jgi:hypothetical protein